MGVAHGVQDVPHELTLASETHMPLQKWYPVMHVPPHTPAVHVAVPFITGGHAVQVPQCERSFVRLASQPLDAMPSQSPNPVLQVNPHAPAVHVAVELGGVGHAMPHAPHEVTVLSEVSHPFEAMPSQLPKPAVHGPSEHAPPAQMPAAFMKVHAWPQLPQFADE
jgi:hypothetical protein